jgi:hypothetical protein
MPHLIGRKLMQACLPLKLPLLLCLMLIALSCLPAMAADAQDPVVDATAATSTPTPTPPLAPPAPDAPAATGIPDSSLASPAATTTAAAKVNAIRRVVLNEDYPERFAGHIHRVRIDSMVLADLDGDGIEEAVVVFSPHYRQSPTVALFRLKQEGARYQASRVREGLAPGPLRPLTGRFHDSHALGLAEDLRLSPRPDGSPVPAAELLAAAAQAGWRGLVQYRGFVHADLREGSGTYLDMTHAQVPGDDPHCAHFEFALVNELAVGAARPGEPALHIAARVHDEITFYRITSIDSSGLLTKQAWRMKVPADFDSLVALPEVRQGMSLQYRSSSGALRVLTMEGAVRVGG